MSELRKSLQNLMFKYQFVLQGIYPLPTERSVCVRGGGRKGLREREREIGGSPLGPIECQWDKYIKAI